MNIDKLIAQQKRIEKQIEAAKAVQSRIRRLSIELGKHPEILEKLSDRQIIEALQDAVEHAEKPATSPPKSEQAVPVETSGANSGANYV